MTLVPSLPEENSSFPSFFKDVAQHFQIRLLARLILDDLHTNHHAFPSDIPNERAISFLFYPFELP